MIFKNRQKGIALINVIIFGTIAVVLVVGLVSWFGVTLRGTRQVVLKEKAFQIAEAGTDYYRWHLAHAPSDFKDGTEIEGPYVHDFFNSENEKIGEFSLNIIPPPLGSTLVTIESTGRLMDDPSVSRTIRTQLAIPSFARYAFVADSDMRFGEGTEVFGPIHSNGGIRFDGLAHNIVTSSRESYDDPDHSGPYEFGVHTHLSPIDPNPPSSLPDRFDVFEAGRLFPVPAVDFVGMVADLSEMRTLAQQEGKYFSDSGALGYRIVLKTNDTYDVYRVKSLIAPHFSCNNVNGDSDWGSWSIKKDQFIANYPNPSNGIIFFEDHVWVEGKINTARITIVAGRFPDTPSTRRNIIINNDILYTNYDGQDIIGLIAQKNVNVGLISDDNLQIDGALLAQNGRVGRHYYRPPFSGYQGCSSNHTKDTITLWGMIGSRERYGFAWSDGTGYEIRNINYDAHLLYAPPPNFPLTSEQYETVTWEEVE